MGSFRPVFSFKPRTRPSRAAMSSSKPPAQREERLYVLVTGANSGLGLAICLRLIDEFVTTHLKTSDLHLIITTRDEQKSRKTIATLSGHLEKQSRLWQVDLREHVSFRSEQVDLSYLPSVKALSKLLRQTLPRLDVIHLNAGYGAILGINWPKAIWKILTNFPDEVTYPTFNIGGIGYVTKPQIAGEDIKSPLGQVFCSNVFGHYLLVSYLAPLFQNRQASTEGTTNRNGRVIWISSLEAYASTFSLDDLQGINSPLAYNSSKRLTDILALTSSLPTTRRYVNGFLSGPTTTKQYLSQPGICATSFHPVSSTVLSYIMLAAFYLARWVGSAWHTVTPYKGACSPVWLTYASQEELDAFEQEGAGKWGSCVNRGGRERVVRTEVEGWGLNGKIESLSLETERRRRKGVKDVAKAERDTFDETGVECWQRMEALREEWCSRLESFEEQQAVP
ncbi:MAG: hypothetical protein Q9191_003966 [Dirinaria sp. TL-2023a]